MIAYLGDPARRGGAEGKRSVGYWREKRVRGIHDSGGGKTEIAQTTRRSGGEGPRLRTPARENTDFIGGGKPAAKRQGKDVYWERAAR